MVLNSLPLLRLTVAVSENSGKRSPTPSMLSLLKGGIEDYFLKFLLLGGAGLTNPEDIDGEPFYFEAPGKLVFQPYRLKFCFVQVGNRFAPDTHQVMMRPQVRFDPQRTMVKTDFLEDSAVQKNTDIFVDRGQGNGRDLLLHLFVNCLRAGMSGQRHNRLVDDLSLMGGGQTMPAA